MIRTNTTVECLTVAIFSGQHLTWLGLQQILESSRAFRVIGQPLQRLTPDALTSERPADVVILDCDTEREILETIQQIRESLPTAKIIALGGFEDKERLRDAVEHGVDGVILKIHPPAVILAAIDALFPSSDHNRDRTYSGTTPIGINDSRQDLHNPLSPVVAWPDALTEREREVIVLVGRGLSNKDIAHHLSIADSTVRHHLTSIFDKVGVPNRQKLLLHTHRLNLSPD